MVKWEYNEWVAFRKNIISERGEKCEVCGKMKPEIKQLNLHHLPCLNHWDSHDTRPDYYVLVCNVCHLKKHRADATLSCNHQNLRAGRVGRISHERSIYDHRSEELSVMTPNAERKE